MGKEHHTNTGTHLRTNYCPRQRMVCESGQGATSRKNGARRMRFHDVVEFVGMKMEDNLNGKFGVVKKYIASKRRFEVDIRSQTERIAIFVKEENLNLVYNHETFGKGPKHCMMCNKKGVIICYGCYSVYYCSNKCMNDHYELIHVGSCDIYKIFAKEQRSNAAVVEEFDCGGVALHGFCERLKELKLRKGIWRRIGCLDKTPFGAFAVKYTNMDSYWGFSRSDRNHAPSFTMIGVIYIQLNRGTNPFSAGIVMMLSQLLQGANDVWIFTLNKLVEFAHYLCVAHTAETNRGEIRSWKDYYLLRKIPPQSPIAHVMSFILTLYYILIKYGKFTKDTITIHQIGVEIELDLIPLYKELLCLMPGYNFKIIMFAAPNDIMPELLVPFDMKPITLKVDGIKNQINIECQFCEYGTKDHGKPDIVVGLNAGFEHESYNWRSAVRYILDNKIKAVFSNYGNNDVYNAEALVLKQKGKLSFKYELNPFRSPLVELFPASPFTLIRNGLLYGINCLQK